MYASSVGRGFCLARAPLAYYNEGESLHESASESILNTSSVTIPSLDNEAYFEANILAVHTDMSELSIQPSMPTGRHPRRTASHILSSLDSTSMKCHLDFSPSSIIRKAHHHRSYGLLSQIPDDCYRLSLCRRIRHTQFQGHSSDLMLLCYPAPLTELGETWTRKTNPFLFRNQVASPERYE